MSLNLNIQQPPLSVESADSASVDAFGKWRISEPFGIFDNKNVMSRNRNQWNELIKGVIIVHGAVTGGPFVVGETVTGSLSLVEGIIDVVGAGSVTITVTNGTDFDITTPDVLTGGTSGAQANVTSANTGSNIVHLPDEAAVELKCGQGATDYAIRETNRPFAYVPGKSQEISETFVLGVQKANVVQRVGYFNVDNGIYLEQTETEVNLVIRTSTSGSPSETKVEQADWELDKLDGSGDSRTIIDFTKAQIFQFDFQWLGSGRVRFGFNIKGMKIYVHEVNNANALEEVYMSTPTLPMRYELRNVGVPASDTTMKEICCSVVSEGGYSLPGFEFAAGSKNTPRTGITTRTPIMAIRLKSTFNGKDNRRIGRFLHANFFATGGNAFFEISHVHNPTGVYGVGGAPTLPVWNDVGGGSAVEYSTDITSVVGRPEHVVGDEYVATGQAGKGGGNEEDATFINLHSFFAQNEASDNSQMYVIYATAVTGTVAAYTTQKWIEFD